MSYFESCAASETALPAEDTSLPAPEMVLQALSVRAPATSATAKIFRIIICSRQQDIEHPFPGRRSSMRYPLALFRCRPEALEDAGYGRARKHRRGGEDRCFRAHYSDSESGGA